MALAAGRATARDCLYGSADQRFGVFLRIADRRRAHDELRADAVERTDPLQPPQHIRKV